MKNKIISFLFLLVSFNSFSQDSSLVKYKISKLSKIEIDSLQRIESDKFLKSLNHKIFAETGNAYIDSLEKLKKSSMLSFTLSTVIPIPGVGQVYNNDYWKAIILASGFTLGALISFNYEKDWNKDHYDFGATFFRFITGLFIMSSTKIWSMYDAPVTTAEKNKVIDAKIAKYKELKETLKQNDNLQ